MSYFMMLQNFFFYESCLDGTNLASTFFDSVDSIGSKVYHWIPMEYIGLQELGSISARVLINQSVRACELEKLLLMGLCWITLNKIRFGWI